jgi:hypothetical protein
MRSGSVARGVPVTRSPRFVFDGVDRATAQREDVSELLILHLPFRLRTGPFLDLDLADPLGCRVMLVNQVAVRADQQVISDPGLTTCLLDGQLWTDVVIERSCRDLSDEELALIRGTATDAGPTFFPVDHDSPTDALNRVIVAYHVATGVTYGGRRLSLWTPLEFSRHLRWSPTLLTRGGRRLTEAEVLRCLGEPFEPEQSREGFFYDCEDCPDSALRLIPEALAAVGRHEFYTSACRAEFGLAHRDITQALLLSVIALEGVLAAFVHYRLDERTAGTAKQQFEATSDFMRKNGISSLVRLVPALLMSADERPDDGLVNLCAAAITKRNKIVHSVRTPDGHYTSRRYSAADLAHAAKTVLGMYRHYLSLVHGHENSTLQ